MAAARWRSSPDLSAQAGHLRTTRRRLRWRDLAPPENELQKGCAGAGAGALSEHQLRVQRSLQRLHVPDWYKHSALAAPGFLLRRSSADAHHWPGLASKTTSLSSLGGQSVSGATSAAVSPSPSSASAYASAYAAHLGATSTPHGHSPTGQPLLSPSPIPHGGGGSGGGAFSRWSTSRLCGGSATTSASTSPGGSARSSFNYRQPYLGWRSQERLARPRTPAERLAAGLLADKQAAAVAAAVHQHQQQQQQQQSPAPASSPSQQPTSPLAPADHALGLALAARSPTAPPDHDHDDYDQTPQVPNLSEVRTSIKEVTSAIVHYVSGVRDDGSSEALTAPQRHDSSISPRSSSPRGSGRLCWVESSFVGSRPLDSPETPLSLTGSDPTTKMGDLYLELNKSQGFSQLNGEPQLVM
ncbi:hypothetical protein R5R35_011884 [Gryllus longicercus]|uniref:Uncharacterized protein n=1 Tax=Gryllus longicercus TaxID=2509291 RepID=A0AAN9W1D6_9ORTH